jgi:hypothetical protein
VNSTLGSCVDYELFQQNQKFKISKKILDLEFLASSLKVQNTNTKKALEA